MRFLLQPLYAYLDTIIRQQKALLDAQGEQQKSLNQIATLLTPPPEEPVATKMILGTPKV